MSPGPVRQDFMRGSGTRGRPYTLRSSTNSPTKALSPPPQATASLNQIPRYPVPATPSIVLAPLANKPLDLGMPTKQQYDLIEKDYVDSLNPRKREKALLCQAQFDMIWEVLHEPNAARVSTPQFRWWVRKMFVLSYPSGALSDAELASIGGDPEARTELPVVLHQDRPVALREQIYDIMCYCHHLSNHGGRDRTTAAVREHYSWIPKDLIARFVKVCPTCIYKKTRNPDVVTPLAAPGDHSLVKLEAKDRGADPMHDLENVPPIKTTLVSDLPTMSRAAALSMYGVPDASEELQSRAMQHWPPNAGPASLPPPHSRLAMESAKFPMTYAPVAVSMPISVPVHSCVAGSFNPPLQEMSNLNTAHDEQPGLSVAPLMLPSLSHILTGMPSDSNTAIGHDTHTPFKFGVHPHYVPQIDPALLRESGESSHDIASNSHSGGQFLDTVNPALLFSADARARRMDIASLLNTPGRVLEQQAALHDTGLNYSHPPGLRAGADDVFYAGSPVLSVSHAVSYERLSALAEGSWDCGVSY